MQQAYAQANEIVTQATAQAQEIVDNATMDANEIRIGCDPVIQMTFLQMREASSVIHWTAIQTKYDGLINSLQECYDTVPLQSCRNWMFLRLTLLIIIIDSQNGCRGTNRKQGSIDI